MLFTISQIRTKGKWDLQVIHFFVSWGGYIFGYFTKSPKKINKRYIYRCSKICYNMQRSTWEREVETGCFVLRTTSVSPLDRDKGGGP